MPVAKTAKLPSAAAPTFESVWIMMQENAVQMEKFMESQRETDRQLKESQRETDRLIKESQRETDRQLKESQRETDRIFKERAKELNIRIGSLTNLFGDFTVGMIVPKIREKFTELGLVFLKSSPNVEVNDTQNKIAFEIDILLENGDKAMLIEVKTKLTKERINKHIQRLGKMRKYADMHGDKRAFLGAVAGFAIREEVRNAALSQGFYLIEPDGENFNITSPQGKPKEW